MAMPNVKRGAFAYALQPDAVPAVRENAHLFLAVLKYSAKVENGDGHVYFYPTLFPIFP
jgi:hypothetical protein